MESKDGFKNGKKIVKTGRFLKLGKESKKRKFIAPLLAMIIIATTLAIYADVVIFHTTPVGVKTGPKDLTYITTGNNYKLAQSLGYINVTQSSNSIIYIVVNQSASGSAVNLEDVLQLANNSLANHSAFKVTYTLDLQNLNGVYLYINGQNATDGASNQVWYTYQQNPVIGFQVGTNAKKGETGNLMLLYNVAPITTYYVSTAGSDSNAGSYSAPFQTIQQGITAASIQTGNVVIYVESGTYEEQLTMSNIVLPKTVVISGIGTVAVEPTAAEMTTNIFEAGNTHYLFDDFQGWVSAIIGVENCSAEIIIQNLIVSGINYQTTALGGQIAGIAYINTSGIIQNNYLNYISDTYKTTYGNAGVHGIEVKSLTKTDPRTVDIYSNVMGNNSGHVYIDIISNGSLASTCAYNTLLGNYSSANPVPSAGQTGIVATNLTYLSISSNTFTNFSDVYVAAAIWLNPQPLAWYTHIVYNTITRSDMGIALAGARNTYISGNDIHAGYPIWIGSWDGAFGTKLSGDSVSNTITDNLLVGETTIAALSNQTVGIQLYNGTGNTIEYNNITGCYFGVYVGTGGQSTGGSVTQDKYASNSFEYNDIALNTVGFNNTVAVPVTATHDWWGSATGPYNATLNPSGTGNAVFGDVTFEPYATTPYSIST